MRTSMVSATFLLLGASAAAVGATSGDNIVLNGSDTLFQVTTKVMALCNGTSGPSNGNIAGHGLSYAGGGSGVGAAQMDLQLQEMAPMSRALKNTEYCNAAAADPIPAITTQSSTNAIMVGLDGVAIMANTANICSPDLAKAGAGRTFTYSGGTYTIGNSLDVLRLVYGGTDSAGAYTGDLGCNGPIRKALVSNWQALFNSMNCGAAPNCPAEYTVGGVTTDVTSGLTHAWRRSDLSGTTDAFQTLVNFGSRKVGPNPAAPNANTAANPLTTNAFCNSKDANDGSKSFAGASDYADNDPIRVTCDDNDTVCGKDNTLGLVLPVLLPRTRATLPASRSRTPFPASPAARSALSPIRAIRISPARATARRSSVAATSRPSRTATARSTSSASPTSARAASVTRASTAARTTCRSSRSRAPRAPRTRSIRRAT